MLKVALTGKISEFLEKVTSMPDYRTFNPKDIIKRDMQIWMEEFGGDMMVNVKVENADANKVKLDFCMIVRNNLLGVPVAREFVTANFENGFLVEHELIDEDFDSFDNPNMLQVLYNFYTHILIFMFFDKKYATLMETEDNELLTLIVSGDEIEINLTA